MAVRYVSGCILTDPPPGRPRLVAAGASHAWLSVHCPWNDWVELDPTSNLVPDRRHVTLASGREQGDVGPLRCVNPGGAQHTLHVGVSVILLDEWWKKATTDRCPPSRPASDGDSVRRPGGWCLKTTPAFAAR
jgi:transglutaminase-like putative cysteine protease